jgi:hypothetical protein
MLDQLTDRQKPWIWPVDLRVDFTPEGDDGRCCANFILEPLNGSNHETAMYCPAIWARLSPSQFY